MKQMNFLSLAQDDLKIHWTLFIDGAARNNPGPAGAGVYLLKNAEEAYKQGFFLGVKTNNQAEYLALLIGIFILNQYATPNDTIRIVSDSQLLVKQFTGEYAVRHPELKPLHLLARTLLQRNHVHIEHVLRADNSNADQLANLGIDKKIPLPTEFIEMLRAHEIIL